VARPQRPAEKKGGRPADAVAPAASPGWRNPGARGSAGAEVWKGVPKRTPRFCLTSYTGPVGKVTQRQGSCGESSLTPNPGERANPPLSIQDALPVRRWRGTLACQIAYARIGHRNLPEDRRGGKCWATTPGRRAWKWKPRHGARARAPRFGEAGPFCRRASTLDGSTITLSQSVTLPPRHKLS
jgi:hypothetical protein